MRGSAVMTTTTTTCGPDRQRESTAFVSGAVEPGGELVVSGWLDVALPPDAAMVLRAFDDLRREVALQVDGQPGMGVGYTLLDISWSRLRALGPNDRVTLAATVLTRRHGRHEVAYVASILPVRGQPGTMPTVIVRARGWTVSRKTETEKRES